jgi:hypothetical protein
VRISTILRPIGAVAAMVGIVGGCFRDPGPGQLCETAGAACTSTSSSGTTEPPPPPTTGGGSSSTGGTVDRTVAFRLSELAFIDPHVFLVDPLSPILEASTGDTAGDTGMTETTGAPDPGCTDVTMTVNGLLNNEVKDGSFNLLIYFEELVDGTEMRLVEADCSDPGDGSPWTCVDRKGSQKVLLSTRLVTEPPCREIDPSRYSPVTLPMLNDPAPPCLRTDALNFAIPVPNAASDLSLREAQFVGHLDDLEDPPAVLDGLISGFLTKVSAQGLTLEVALIGEVDLWSLIDVPECAAAFPELLPSIDTLDPDGSAVPGVWMAINFTATRVLYSPP